MVHLTEKPVELAVRALQYSSRPGENVLDLFAGSGSTLIAAEQTGRRAFVMELDPLYCDPHSTQLSPRLREPKGGRYVATHCTRLVGLRRSLVRTPRAIFSNTGRPAIRLEIEVKRDHPA